VRIKYMLVTKAGAARIWNMSEKTADRILKDLPAVIVGKRKRWPLDVVEAFARPAGVGIPTVRPAA
jgi:hypothetical protein